MPERCGLCNINSRLMGAAGIPYDREAVRSGKYYVVIGGSRIVEPCVEHLIHYQASTNFVETCNCQCVEIGADRTKRHTERSNRVFRHNVGRDMIEPCLNHVVVYAESEYFSEVTEITNVDTPIAPCPHGSHGSNIHAHVYGNYVFERPEGTRFAACEDHRYLYEPIGYRCIGTRERIEEMRKSAENRQEDERKWIGEWTVPGKKKKFKPTQTYIVRQREDGVFDCSCADYRFQEVELEAKEACIHILSIQLKLSAEHGLPYMRETKRKDKPIRHVRFED